MMREILLATLFVVLCVCSATRTSAANYSVGLSNVDVTPNTSRNLMGYSNAALLYYVGTTRPMAVPGTYQDPTYPQYSNLGLTIRAVYIAFPDGTQPLIMVSADIAHLCPMDSEYARDPANYTIPNLTRDRVMINVTHTHNSLPCCDLSTWVLGEQQAEDSAPFGDWRANVLRPKLREAIQQAYNNREPANLHFMRNKVNIGINRRTGSRADMTDQYGTTIVDLNGYDQTLDVVEIYRDDISRKGVLFFYGAHPVLLGTMNFPDGQVHYHPDYPGFARKKIEDATPSVNDIAIFFQAAGADVNGYPDSNLSDDSPTGRVARYNNSRIAGESLAQKALEMMAETGVPNSITQPILPAQGGNLAYSHTWGVHLQTSVGAQRLGGSAGEPRGLAVPAPSPGVSATDDWGRWASFHCNDTYGHGGGNGACGDSPKGTPIKYLDTEIQTFQIGNWKTAGLSHELVGRWGVALRQRWPAQWVTALGYINRVQTYLTTRAMVDEDDVCWKYSVGCKFEAFVAQFYYGLPAPWATYATTGGAYDLDGEIRHILYYASGSGQDTRTNVARPLNGGTASASSASSNYEATKVNDGDRKGGDPYFWADSTPGTFGDWVQVDFNGLKSINEIDVVTLQDNLSNPVEPTLTQTFSSYGVTQFQVEYWNGSNWVPIPGSPVTGNNKVWRQFLMSPITTSKIRVTVNAVPDNNYSRIVELEAWGTPADPTHTNMALTWNGGTATASSALSNYEATKVNDGDRKGGDPYFWADSTPGTFGDWVQVDFNGLKSINEINVVTLQDNLSNPVEPTLTQTFSSYGVTQFQVEYWNGSNWVSIAGSPVTGNNKVWRQFLMSPITTSKIRVTVNAAPDSYYSRIVELEAWGSD